MKKKDDSVQKLDFSDEFLLESIDKRYQEGNYLGALTLLNKRNSMHAPSADACALAADIYEEMGLYHLSADAWFRFLDTCNEADFSEGYEGLAVAFMNLGHDVQSSLYYQRFLSEAGGGQEGLGFDFPEEPSSAPKIKLLRSDDEEAPEILAEGLALLKSGELDEARNVLMQIMPQSPDYPVAAGLSAMCLLMNGKEEEAQKECAALLERYPDNVQALTTYCAVLGAREDKEGAAEIARRLSAIKADSTDDLYRIATALCETGLDAEAYEKLKLLKGKLPYDDNVLYFHAVAAYHTGHLEESIESLDRLTTIYPRKAVANYYLVRMRELLDGAGEKFPMTYFYRVPEDEYNAIAGFLLAAGAAEGDYELRRLGELKELKEFFRIAFDEMEGRDEKLQILASKVAVKLRADDFLREVLLDYEGDDVIKLSILHELSMRNEEDSFGTVLCNLYKEFFTHTLEIGNKKKKEFLRSFADVYSKFAILSEENERKICLAAEDVYATLEEAEAWNYFDERASLAAAIYRESRLKRGERKLEAIVGMFEANKFVTQEILDFMM